MADNPVATTVAGALQSWTFRTVLIAFFLCLMLAVWYLYDKNTKMYEAQIKTAIELSECKSEVKWLRERK